MFLKILNKSRNSKMLRDKRKVIENNGRFVCKSIVFYSFQVLQESVEGMAKKEILVSFKHPYFLEILCLYLTSF